MFKVPLMYSHGVPSHQTVLIIRSERLSYKLANGGFTTCNAQETGLSVAMYGAAFFQSVMNAIFQFVLIV